MSFQCDLLVSGVLPEDSIKAFKKSYDETSKMSHYRKDLNHIRDYFKNKLERNIAQAGIRDPTIKDSFSVEIIGNSMVFSSNNQKTLTYEYGTGHLPPRRYLQPSIIDTANEMPSIILNDAIEVYNKNVKFGVGTKQEQIPNLVKTNKYSKMLK